MGLLDDLKDESNFPRPARAWCSVCTLVQELPKAESALLQERFENKNITHIALASVLKANGYDISESVIGRHRRKVCSGGVKR